MRNSQPDTVDRFNHRRLHTSISMIPLVEAEQRHYHSPQAPVADSERVPASLR